MRFLKRKAQSTLEYAVIIAVVAAALVVMNIYMKRGMQGKLRESADKIGEQYSAGRTTSKVTTQQIEQSKVVEKFGLDESDVPAKGVSYYEVVTPAEVQRHAQGDDAEKVVELIEEGLFE